MFLGWLKSMQFDVKVQVFQEGHKHLLELFLDCTSTSWVAPYFIRNKWQLVQPETFQAILN